MCQIFFRKSSEMCLFWWAPFSPLRGLVNPSFCNPKKISMSASHLRASSCDSGAHLCLSLACVVRDSVKVWLKVILFIYALLLTMPHSFPIFSKKYFIYILPFPNLWVRYTHSTAGSHWGIYFLTQVSKLVCVCLKSLVTRQFAPSLILKRPIID